MLIKNFKSINKEYFYIFIFCLLAIIIHSFISRYHFHELETKYKDVVIELKENPFIVENNTYFDSMNYHENFFMRSANSYSRPNNIYIFPVEIRKSEK